MSDINEYSAGSGRMIKEDNTIVNIADKIDTLIPTQTIFTFQDAVETTGQGNILTVENFKKLTVDIFGTATERAVKFYSMNLNENLVPLGGRNISSLVIGTSSYLSPSCTPINIGTNNSETFQFEITNLNKIVMNVTTVNGGNLTVKGTLS